MATEGTFSGTQADAGFEEAAERIREINERIMESAKKSGSASLDAYERALRSMADFQEKVGGASQIEWVSSIARAQADFTREMVDAYISAARTLLK
jgi:hypothetical protein